MVILVPGSGYRHIKWTRVDLGPDSLKNSVYLEGSTAKTATLLPSLVSILPSDSMNVLLPAPGGPDKPVAGQISINQSSCLSCQ